MQAAPDAEQARRPIAVPPAVLAGLPPAPQTPAQQAVVAAREASQRKQWSVLGALAPQARTDPLGMYPEYWLLRYQLWSPPGGRRPDAELQRFLAAHAGSYLEDRLRGDWIQAAARAGDFETVRRLGPVKQGNAQIACAGLDARHMTGQRASAAEAVAAFAPGTACWALYDQLVADGVLGWDEIQPQLRDAIEAGKLSDARKLAQYIFEPKDQKSYDQMMKNPMKWLVRQDKSPVGRNEKELVTLALARLNKPDVSVADSYLRREWSRHLPRQNLAWVRSQYALVAVLNQDPRAYEWYREAGAVRMTEYSHAWKVRSALRQPRIDWKWVIEAIEGMPPSQQAEPVWVYWKARGQAALAAPSRPARPMPASPTSSISMASWPPRNWAAASPCRRRPRRSPMPRSPRPARIPACAARSTCSAWAGAPKPCRSGISRCAACPTASCSPPPSWRAPRASTTAWSIPPSAPPSSSISASASSRPSKAGSAPRRAPSTWTRPGCMA